LLHDKKFSVIVKVYLKRSMYCRFESNYSS
jgi:hypothetical protein